MSLPGAGTAGSGAAAFLPPPSQIRLSFGLYFFDPSSAFAFVLESSTRFHKLAILEVTFLFG